MAETSTIEWTDATWNPIRGCTRVSPGCGGPGPHGGCYAEAIAARFSGPGQPYEGLAERRDGKPRWTGRISFGHDLDAPLRWRRPRRIFVNSMSDLFHEGLSVSEIATVYAVCVAAHHLNGHTSQILTKRSARMREVLASDAFWDQVNAEAGAHVMAGTDPLARRSNNARATLGEYGPTNPPPGIWLGVSAEDQRRADERVPDLLATPAVVRFVSAEPLLGSIDFEAMPFADGDARHRWSALTGQAIMHVTGEDGHPDFTVRMTKPIKPRLDQIIVGGESGPRARPMHPDWVRSILGQCTAAGTAFFFKQWGEWSPCVLSEDAEGELSAAYPLAGCTDAAAHRPDQPVLFWQADAWIKWPLVEELPAVGARRVGKKAAGRLLDGVKHNGMPIALTGGSPR